MARGETQCCHMAYSFRLEATVILYEPSHRQVTTYFVTPVADYWLEGEIAQWVHHEGRSDDPSHHERTFLRLSYISLLQALLQDKADGR